MPSGLYPLHVSRNPLLKLLRSSGQAAVEFTLTFLILLIVAWIPADFGLAFYTGQLAQNAAREGARIAAADPTLLGIFTAHTNTNEFIRHVAQIWLAIGLGGLLFRVVQLCLIKDVET